MVQVKDSALPAAAALADANICAVTQDIASVLTTGQTTLGAIAAHTLNGAHQLGGAWNVGAQNITNVAKLAIGATSFSGSEVVNIVAAAPQVRISASAADSTNGGFQLVTKHYLNAEEEFCVIEGETTSGNNYALYGGGRSNRNAATLHRWYAAANYITTTGTSMMWLSTHGLRIQSGATSVASALFHVAATGNADALRVSDSTGNIGIGTAASGTAGKLGWVKYSVAGTGLNWEIEHADNTNASSLVRLTLTSGGSSGGDAYTLYRITSAQDWAIGIDNSDSDKFKISRNTALGTNDSLVITTGDLVGIGIAAPIAKLHVNQASATGAIACLELDQDDQDQPFIDFDGTIAADAVASISSLSTPGSITHWLQIDVEGVGKRWIAAYADPS